jgi:hypothetical protein
VSEIEDDPNGGFDLDETVPARAATPRASDAMTKPASRFDTTPGGY